MSPTPSIPEEPINTGMMEEEVEETRESPIPSQNTSGDEDEEASQAPLHPVPSMQGAFEESMYEQGHPPPSPTNPYAVATTISNGIAAPFRQKYHPLTKLISQIAFGIHLLHKRLAKSDSEVVRILQAHVNDMDTFLSTTTADFDLARSDVSARVKNLKVPLEAGPASDVFENMLREPAFRAQIMEGNKKVEFVIKRTARAMNRALEDIGEGLKAVDELAKYLLTLKTGWRNANLTRVYGAMTHNVEGWFRCFVGLQMKGQGLGERLNTLRTVVWEIDRRCGRASRGHGTRGSQLVVKKRPSLNQIMESPGEGHDPAIVAPPASRPRPPQTKINTNIKLFSEKPLPTTPIPTPIVVNAPNDALSKETLSKRHTVVGDLNSPPTTPRRTLSKKRRSVSNPLDLKNEIPHMAGAESTVETVVVVDEERGQLRRKKLHRRSLTVHATTPTASFRDAAITAAASNTAEPTVETPRPTSAGGVLSSLRRSLSVGRSRNRDGTDGGRGTTPGAPPPVPELPASVQRRMDQIAQGKRLSQQLPTAAVADSTAEPVRPKSSGVGASVTGAVKSSFASLTKRKSRAHLHHPSGSHLVDAPREAPPPVPEMPIPGQIRRTRTEPSLNPTANASSIKPEIVPMPKAVKAKPAPIIPPPAPAVPSTPPRSRNNLPQTPTTPGKPRRNSTAAHLTNLWSMRPRSRHGSVVAAPESPAPPMPISKITKAPPPHLPSTSDYSTRVMSLSAKDKATGKRIGEGSSILAGVRELNDKNSVAKPEFKLQTTCTAGPAEPVYIQEKVHKAPRQFAGHVPGKKEVGSSGASTSGPSAPHSPPTKGKSFFLVKFFTDRSF
ncbi:hypothetical protein DFH27DRAFT_526270 [Peziza echinospora]|nr:hypothetical protein DFH27DRAFT_526270 [Peziza echinospora]